MSFLTSLRTNRLTGSRRDFIKTAVLGTSAASAASFLGTWSAEGAEKVLTVAIPSNPVTFDPVNAANHDAMVVSQTIFENLVQVDIEGKTVQPQLAVALPTISTDRLIYTFDLRDDVFFQNGQRFSAEDVKYSFEYVIDPKNHALRQPLFNRIKSIVVESPTRVRIELSEPYRPWLFYLTKYMGIFPKGSREQHGSDFFKAGPIGVGTGPGIFVEWLQNDSITLRKNPNYWRKGFPLWDRLVVKLIPEDSVRVAYLTTGQVDIISSPPPKDFLRLKNLPGLRGGDKLMLGGWFVMSTNTKKAPFTDLHARKAVSHAIDRSVIAQKVFYGLLDPSAIPAPSKGWWYSKEANDLNDFDLNKAEDSLKQSSYPNGFDFEMSIPSIPYLVDVKDAAVVIQSQLAKLNIGINIRINEMGILLNEFRQGVLTCLTAVQASPGEPTYLIDLFYGKDNVFSKGTGYENPEVWQLIQDSYAHNSEQELKPIFDQMLKILARDSPNVWLGNVHATNLWRDLVKNFQVNQGLTMRVQEVGKA